MISNMLLGIESLGTVVTREAIVRHLVVLHHVGPQLRFQHILNSSLVSALSCTIS